MIEGRLVPGTKLPPQRELADYLDVNLSMLPNRVSYGPLHDEYKWLYIA
ncbi:GntR family transcriptional regulator [Streptomyces sp. ISL-14]|nr:GntR family transcriptional regulator [Streptomyces sp. ISL-14]